MRPALDSGRLLQAVSDGCRRGMTVLDRTRLTGQLLFFLPSAPGKKISTSCSTLTLFEHLLVIALLLFIVPLRLVIPLSLFPANPSSHKAFSVNWWLDAVWAPFYSVQKWVEVGRSGFFWVNRCHTSGSSGE